MRALHGGDVPLVVHPAQLGVSRIRGTRFRFQKEVGSWVSAFLRTHLPVWSSTRRRRTRAVWRSSPRPLPRTGR